MLPLKEIVLLGAGHTHAHVLRMWKMQPMPDVRLTCVSNFPLATYSGMLPGVLAGQYRTDEMQIDLVRFCASAGVRLILDSPTGLELSQGQVLFSSRPALPFDLLSIGIGSRPDLRGIELTRAHAVAIKPMQTFLERLETAVAQAVVKSPTELRITIVGGGAGGVEVALCLPPRLQTWLNGRSFHISLIQRDPEILSGSSATARRRVTRELAARGVQLLLGKGVAQLTAENVVMEDGQSLASDVSILATSARGPELLGELGLPLDERGFLRTHATLQSIGDPRIFAVGDAGTIEGLHLPKAGVYAVREGPVLWTNLHRALNGQALQPYRPQRSFLRLLNLGDGRAVMDYRGYSASGRWCWRWKDRIDRQFMQKYQTYQAMQVSMPDDTARPTAMRCAGCGGKIGANSLRSVLSQLDPAAHPDVLIGLNAPDDAALLRVTGERLAISVDHFTPPLDDVYLSGRIAALNAVSDLFAFGAAPTVALASVTVPYGPASRQRQVLLEVLAGALAEFRPLRVSLAGGHTIEGAQMSIGFTVLGPANERIWTKNGLQAGDLLGLTKPLGTGTLLAGHMQAALQARWWQSLLDGMLTSNEQAASLLRAANVSAVTDVTGFGLAGHLIEMLEASGQSAEIWLDALPLLPGAAELLDEGFESTLAPENREAERWIEVRADLSATARYRALFDPQTSGGLLFGIAEENRATLEQAFQSRAASLYWIGQVQTTERSRTSRRLFITACPQ